MKKIIAGVIVIILIIVGVSYFGKNSKQSAVKEPIKIGAILPETGPASFVGEGMSSAVQMAVQEINEQGGINNQQIQLIIEDSKSEGKGAVSAIQKLINIDKVDLLIGGSTFDMMAVAPIAEDNKIPIITPCSSKPAITEGKDYIFRLMASDNIQARWAAFVAHSSLNKKRVAILYANDEWGVGFRDEFVDEFNKLGGTIVREETYAKGSTDLKTQLIKIKNENPEIVLFLGVEAETILGFKQMAQLNINLPILGGASWSNPKIWNELGKLGNDAMYVRVHTEEKGEFQRKFSEKTGSSQIAICTPEAYDAVFVLKEAIEKAKTFDKIKIKEAIYNVKMNGVSGAINFNSEGDRYPVKMGVFKVKDSKAEEVFVKDY